MRKKNVIRILQLFLRCQMCQRLAHEISMKVNLHWGPWSSGIMVHFMDRTRGCTWGSEVENPVGQTERDREEERVGVRCDIDDKPVYSSLVSPWLNVRSQWKGGTTNATELQWQPDPWERKKYPFNQMPPFLPSASFLPSLPFFFVMSNLSLLNLCFFTIYRPQRHQLLCSLCSFAPFCTHIHVCWHT